ncbi:hypothetical protein [Virgibacillus halodenitrificans]|uniref:hypothetical protein n=1 Tax=Virgibacillus halodenitrificans TaxID=1482 RepID=UPI00155DAFDF
MYYAWQKLVLGKQAKRLILPAFLLLNIVNMLIKYMLGLTNDRFYDYLSPLISIADERFHTSGYKRDICSLPHSVYFAARHGLSRPRKAQYFSVAVLFSHSFQQLNRAMVGFELVESRSSFVLLYKS